MHACTVHNLFVLMDIRYCNMTWSLASALRNVRVPVLHTYDINCQFSRNLWERFGELPQDLLDALMVAREQWTHLIPKLHLMGHVRKCHALFSLNYAIGTARTCGEAIERMWALINGIATSVREMGPGHRLDSIDSHMGHHNFRKQCRMRSSIHLVLHFYLMLIILAGDTLARRLLEAIPMSEDLYQEFALLNQAVRARDETVLATWEAEYTAWVNGDHTGVCPFETEDAYKRKPGVVHLRFTNMLTNARIRLDLGHHQELPCKGGR
jgi:hypothetical protein